MRSWIQHSRGRVARQAHVGVPELGGLHEDLLSRQGFDGADAVFYRRNEPTAWKRIEGNLQALDLDGQMLEPTDRTHPDGTSLPVFSNPDVVISVSRRSAGMPYTARNADGDELYFVHEGSGVFYTEFGPIPYEPGDWVLLPKGVTYRIRPAGPANYFLIIESQEEFSLADIGPIGRHAPFDPSLIFVPQPDLDELGDGRNDEGEWPVRIKARGGYTTVFYDFDPIDAEGWKGDMFPFKLNIRDYRPLSSERIALMPSAHAIFTTSGIVVANFLPRPAEGDPDASRIPPFHRNVDYDEFMFIHGGDALGLEPPLASMSLFPQGLHHGAPALIADFLRQNWKRDDHVDNKFIAVDTRRPLIATREALATNRAVDQWREGAFVE